VAPESGAPLDINRLQEISQGDTEFEGILLGAFQEDATQQLAAIRAAAEAGSAAQLAAAAHNLKGASSNIGAREAQHICAALERMNPAEDATGTQMLITQLEEEIQRITAFIGQYTTPA
jgi:HPt (histidine-containing phosphotransfer) domain-containing protein